MSNKKVSVSLSDLKQVLDKTYQDYPLTFSTKKNFTDLLCLKGKLLAYCYLFLFIFLTTDQRQL